MRIQDKIGLAVCLILLAGCHPKPAEKDTVISVPFEQANAIDMGQFIDHVGYIQLQNHPESAFTDIDKLIVNGENIFMLDKRLKAIFCFDTTGKFRWRIQRVGRGPGEYQELDAMWVYPAKNELWLQSFWPGKLMVYNFDGQFIRETGIEWAARDMIGLGDNLLAGYNGTASIVGTLSMNAGIYKLDLNGNCQGQALSIGDTSIYWRLDYQRHLQPYNDGALLLSQSDTIYKINNKGEVSPDVFLDWGKLKYPEDLRKICYDSPRSNEAMKGNYVIGKDHLIAFGPIRLFRAFIDHHLEFAFADLSNRKGIMATQITSSTSKIPLLYPISLSDQNELIGIYDMSLLLALDESKAYRKDDSQTRELFHELDSLVTSALQQDRPILWVAKIKQEWLTKTY